MDILKPLEELTGLINLVIIFGIVPLIRMSHELIRIRTKIDIIWSHTFPHEKEQ